MSSSQEIVRVVVKEEIATAAQDSRGALYSSAHQYLIMSGPSGIPPRASSRRKQQSRWGYSSCYFCFKFKKPSCFCFIFIFAQIWLHVIKTFYCIAHYFQQKPCKETCRRSFFPQFLSLANSTG